MKRRWSAARSTLVLVAGSSASVRPCAAPRTGRFGRSSARRSAAATTFVDPEKPIGKPNLAIGVSAVFLGEMFGAEIDVADVPGFFESGDKNLVLDSRVTTFSGNVVVAAPHRLTEYSLRPYIVGGGGLMRVRTTTSFSVFDVSTVIPTFDVGVGVVGFVTNRDRRLLGRPPVSERRRRLR